MFQKKKKPQKTKTNWPPLRNARETIHCFQNWSIKKTIKPLSYFPIQTVPLGDQTDE